MRRFALAVYAALLLTAPMWGPALPAQDAPPDSVSAIRLSGFATRYLALQYAAFGNREYAACLLGTVSGDTVTVALVAPADVTASDSTSVRVLGRCRDVWPGTVGVAHNHPGGVDCSHRLHGTKVPTSDWWAFRRELVAVSLIVCGDSVAAIDRAGREVRAALRGE